MKLFHGTNLEFDAIDLSKCYTNKDFGCGFYLTPQRIQAQNLANFRVLSLGGEEHIMPFYFDENHMKDKDLKVKIFTGYSIEWAQFVLDNRKNNNRENIHPYDIVYGPIADDKIGPQIRRLENGDIDMKTFLECLKYPVGITYQYFFGTEKAIRLLNKL